MLFYFVLVILLCSCNAQFYNINVDGNLQTNEWPSSLPLATGSWYVAMKYSTNSLFVASYWQISNTTENEVFTLALVANPIPTAGVTPTIITCKGKNITLSFSASTYFCLNSTNQMIAYTNVGASWTPAANLNTFSFNRSGIYVTLEMEIPYSRFNAVSNTDNSVTMFGKIIGDVITAASAPDGSFSNFYLSYQSGLASNFPGFVGTYAYAQLTAPYWTVSTNWFSLRSASSGIVNKTNVLLFANSALNQNQNITHLLIYPDVQLTLGQVLTVTGGTAVPAVVYIHSSSAVAGPGCLEILDSPGAFSSVVLSNATGIGTYVDCVAFRGGGIINNGEISMVINNKLIIGQNTKITDNVYYNSNSTLVYESMNSIKAEWPPAASEDDENLDSVPMNVLLSNCQICNITITDNMYLVTRANFTAQNSTATVVSSDVSGGEMLKVLDSVNLEDSSTMILNTNLLVMNTIFIDETSVLQCSDSSQYFVWHLGSESFFEINATLCPTGECVQITDGESYNYSDTFLVNLHSNEFTDTIWEDLISDTDVSECAGDTSCSFEVSIGNTTLRVTAKHIASGCYSTVTFSVIYESNDTSSTTDNISSTTQASESSSEGQPKDVGLIVGVVIGGTAVITAGAIAAFIIVKRRSSNAQQGQDVELNRKRGKTIERDWEIPFAELEFGKELGRGAFGIVYKCRWRNTDCVAKQLDINRNDQQSINQFLKEANNVRGLRPHPNVCNMFGICTDPGHPICIVMEYLPDGALDQLVYQNKIGLNASMIVEIAKDIASGMSHIHQENVLHCDLACRNLLLTARGNNKYQIKIADFGLSRVTETDTYNASTTTSFPVRWTAPETLQSGKIARASDVWSFGVVLWEIAEGKRPYTELSNSEVIKAVCDKGVRLARPERVEVPDELWDLMNKCWDSEENNRPSFNLIYTQLCKIQDKYFSEEELDQDKLNTNEPDTYNNIRQQKEYYNNAQKDYYNNNNNDQH